MKTKRNSEINNFKKFVRARKSGDFPNYFQLFQSMKSLLIVSKFETICYCIKRPKRNNLKKKRYVQSFVSI